MITLSNGYKKPETNDKGPVVFPALEDNIQRVNDHTHDGTDSEPLNPASMTAATQTVLLANWVAQGDGVFKQTVAMPANVNFDNVLMSFRFTDGSLVYLKAVKLTTTTYDLYINDSSKDVVVIYK